MRKAAALGAVFSGVVLVGLLAAGAARAAGERELQLSLRDGLGTVNVDGRHPWGNATGLDVEYGLTDAWALRGSLEGSIATVSKTGQILPGGALYTGAALVGVTYTIDVLRFVPYADLEVGIARIGGAVTAPVTMLASELGLGADYYLTRRVRVGVSFQYLYRPQDLISNPEGLGNDPFTFSATARVAWLF